MSWMMTVGMVNLSPNTVMRSSNTVMTPITRKKLMITITSTLLRPLVTPSRCEILMIPSVILALLRLLQPPVTFIMAHSPRHFHQAMTMAHHTILLSISQHWVGQIQQHLLLRSNPASQPNNPKIKLQSHVNRIILLKKLLCQSHWHTPSQCPRLPQPVL